MWAIAIGNPFDGVRLYIGPDGLPFMTHDKALEMVEKFAGPCEDWNIVPLTPVSNIEDEEDQSCN